MSNHVEILTKAINDVLDAPDGQGVKLRDFDFSQLPEEVNSNNQFFTIQKTLLEALEKIKPEIN